MKAFKYVLLALGGVVLVAAALLAYVALTFDPNKYKPEIVALVKDRTQRTLKLEGDIKLSVFPRIGADLGKVSLSERGSDKEFAGIEAAKVSLALMPLLSGQAIVDAVEVRGLRATVVKAKDGSLNIDDLLAAGAAEPGKGAPAEKPADKAAPVAVDISSVRISDTHLAYRDEASGASYAVSGLTLNTGQLKDGVETPVELTVKLEASKPALRLDIAMKTRMRFEIEAQNLRLAGLDLDAKGDALDIKGLALKASGDSDLRMKSREIVLDRLALAATGTRGKEAFDLKLDAPSLNLTREKVAGSGVAFNAALKGPEGALAAVLSLPSLEGTPRSFKVSALTADLSLKQGQSAVTAKLASPVEGQLDEQTMLPLAVTLAKLAADVDAKQGANAVKAKLGGAIKARFDGRQTLPTAVEMPQLAVDFDARAGENSVKGRLGGALAAKFDGKDMASGRIESPQLALDFDAQAGKNAVKGKLASPLAADLGAQLFSLPKLATSMAVSGPELPNKGFQAELAGSAEANLAKKSVHTSLSGRFDESRIKARLGIVNFAKPAYTVDADIDRLDMDRYLPPAKPGGKAEAKAAAGAKPAAEKPLDFSALKGLDAQGSVRIGSLKVNNIKASNVRVDLRAADGKLRVDPLSANLYGGATTGAIALDADASRVAVKQDLKGVNIEPLLKDAADFDTLSGKGTVSLDLTAQGQTVGAMKKSLGGNAALMLTDGAVKGIDIAGTLRQVKAKLSALKGQQKQDADKSRKTDFAELSGTFKIRNGVAHNDDLAAKSPLLRLAGAGDIDIGNDRIDYTVKATVVATSKGQGGAELAELSGITIPVHLTGPLGAPGYALDYGDMAASLAKKKAEEAIKGQLGDKLAPLLGGGKAAEPSGKAAEPAGKKPGKAAPAPKQEEKKPEDLLKGLFK